MTATHSTHPGDVTRRTPATTVASSAPGRKGLPGSTEVSRTACECCDEQGGTFWTFGDGGTYCDEHATACVGCGTTVSLSATMMCDGCLPEFEWVTADEAADDQAGWLRRPHNVDGRGISVGTTFVDLMTEDGIAVRVRRDQLEQQLRTVRRAETTELNEAGWSNDTHGWWRERPTGPAFDRVTALSMARGAA
jgi:hypothetical protein